MEQPSDLHVTLTDASAHRAGRSIIRIATLEDDPSICFAAKELEDYLRRMTGATAVHVRADEYTPSPDTLWVGSASALGLLDCAEVDNTALDDAIAVNIKDRQGLIVGANPRATLIAIYRYLFELGCRWVRPGHDGEVVPVIDDPLAQDVEVAETPSYRHRGLAIEGACSCEHVIDLIDWLPKVGMNTYFIEYFAGYIFYNNWYSERHKAENAGRLMPEEQANELAERAIAEIKRRGLLFHRAGHGWTCLPLGITPDLWDEAIERDFGEMTRYIALFEGERKLYLGIPRRTNLCYSQPEVRRMVVNCIVQYAREHPEVDYLHFWLADGTNHFCECEDCRRARPADFYVMMLNELDEALGAQGLDTRIVFLVYADLLWAPECETIRNPERFVLMFAPIHRSFYEALDPRGMHDPVPEFVLNQLEFPHDQNLYHLAAWQQAFAGDSFVFDYRFMWGQYDDPGHMAVAQIACEDPQVMGELGINGMVSDQTQRVFWPSGVAMTVLARTLWDHTLEYDAIVDDYFAAAFGMDGKAVRAYLEQLSDSFSPKKLSTYHRADPGPQPRELIERLRQVPTIIDEFRPVIEQNRALPSRPQARSWEYLGLHADVTKLLSRAMEIQFVSGPEQAEADWRALERFVVETEPHTNQIFDVFLFLLSMRRRHQIPEYTAMEDI